MSTATSNPSTGADDAAASAAGAAAAAGGKRTYSDKPRRKICVLGSRNVGKSSLVVQFVESHFVDSYYPTIETTFTKTIKYKGQEYECDIFDTAGQDEYSLINSKHAIGIHGYLLVFSLASRASFEMVQTVHDKLLTYHGLDALPVVVVGQKSDLVQQRAVEREEAEELAKKLKAQYVEVSAAANENVSKAFDLIIAEIEKSNTPPSGEGESKGKCVVQ